MGVRTGHSWGTVTWSHGYYCSTSERKKPAVPNDCAPSFPHEGGIKTGCLVTYFSSSCSGLHDFTGQDMACCVRGAHESWATRLCNGLNCRWQEGSGVLHPSSNTWPVGLLHVFGWRPPQPRDEGLSENFFRAHNNREHTGISGSQQGPRCGTQVAVGSGASCRGTPARSKPRMFEDCKGKIDKKIQFSSKIFTYTRSTTSSDCAGQTRLPVGRKGTWGQAQPL